MYINLGHNMLTISLIELFCFLELLVSQQYLSKIYILCPFFIF